VLQKFKLRLLGNVYELQGDEPDIDLQEVATFVEQKAAEIEQKYSSLPPARQMVLIAMSLGKEYFYLKKGLVKLEEDLNLKLKELNVKIDSQPVEKKD